MEQYINSEQALNAFLHKHVPGIQDFSGLPIEHTGLLSNFPHHKLEHTHFNDLYDTLLYSRLISKAMEMFPEMQVLVDCGAGSSIPTLVALYNYQGEKPRAIAIDVDPAALEVGRKNASELGLEHLYQFKQGKMQELLKTDLLNKPGSLIVSNPPYIPAPNGTDDYHLLPINGGEDGARYIEEFLKWDFPEGTMLALFWGSLCNPSKVIPMMEEKFEVLYVDAVKVHFGNYTTIPVINNHLHELRDNGIVVFDEEESGSKQIVIGTILKPRLK